jgi:hypothetical protein
MLTGRVLCRQVKKRGFKEDEFELVCSIGFGRFGFGRRGFSVKFDGLNLLRTKSSAEYLSRSRRVGFHLRKGLKRESL